MSYESSEHEHRYFIFKTYDSYVPQDPERTSQSDVTITLYQKIEYAILGCNCGSVIKKEVN